MYSGGMIYLSVFSVFVVVVLLAAMVMLMRIVHDLIYDIRRIVEVKPDEINAMGDMMAKVFYPPLRDNDEEQEDDQPVSEYSYPQHEMDDDMEKWIREQMSDVQIAGFIENYHPEHEDDNAMFNEEEQEKGISNAED